MTKTLFSLLLFIFHFSLLSQIIISNNNLTFIQTTVGAKDSLTLYLSNKSTSPQSVVVINSINPSFFPENTIFPIPANDSIPVKIYYAPGHNIIESGSMVFTTSDSSSSAYLNLSGSGRYNDAYQNTTFNLYDTPLKNALNALITNHTSLGYNTARDRMFENIDIQPGDTVECVYTGIKIKAATRTIAQNLGFDTEHTWPQGTFSQNEPMRSDIFHLYPTNSSANNTRGNYPFGFVVSGVNWSVGGSKRGLDASNVTVFEPRDSHKGNVARSMLYFIVRYENYQNYLYTAQENALRQFSVIDPVDSLERRRNLLIRGYQGKTNPFIDHPEFIDRIYSFTTSASFPQTKFLEVFPSALSFDTTHIGSSAPSQIILSNKGNSDLAIDSIVSSNADFRITPVSSIPPYSSVGLPVIFNPSQAGYLTGNITIYSSVGNKQVTVTGLCNQTVGIDDNNNALSFSLDQNYPNPFNNSTRINFSLQYPASAKLTLFDIIGNKVLTLADDYFESGKHSVSFTSDRLSSGIYIYRLETGNSSLSRVMMLLK
ncbi:MAG: endonuclease [Ignavibacteriaceae bacterium]